jgi:hypothetical protein
MDGVGAIGNLYEVVSRSEAERDVEIYPVNAKDGPYAIRRLSLYGRPAARLLETNDNIPWSDRSCRNARSGHVYVINTSHRAARRSRRRHYYLTELRLGDQQAKNHRHAFIYGSERSPPPAGNY